MDSNENLDNPRAQKGIQRLFYETDLMDLHLKKHPTQQRPATYNRGKSPIDLCAGSPKYAKALVAVWYLPFGKPKTIHSDHRSIGLDFNTQLLFG
jgi:hypothetical protein